MKFTLLREAELLGVSNEVKRKESEMLKCSAFNINSA